MEIGGPVLNTWSLLTSQACQAEVSGAWTGSSAGPVDNSVIPLDAILYSDQAKECRGGEVVNASLYTSSFQQCLSSPEWSREQ